MYEIDELDKVVPFSEIPLPTPGVPEPCILADENSVIIFYFLPEKKLIATPSAAFIQFKGCISHMFGMPNDEALRGHPLYKRGLGFYGAYTVENSSWIRKLERMNSVHQMHRPERFLQYRHLIITFHDSTFECVCREFEAKVRDGSEVIRDVAQILSRWPSKA